jgi:hypothetical protein
MKSVLLSTAFIVLLSTMLLAQSRPDPKLTPGAARPLTKQQVCSAAWGKDARHVTPAMKVIVATEYKLKRSDIVAYGHGSCCEFDHRLPRSLAGADSVANLWPQPWVEAKQKDRLEDWAGHQVCTGKMTLKDAQAIFLGDWVVDYQKDISPSK